MPARDFLDPRLTEQRNPRTTGIDVASALEIVDALHAEDHRALEAVTERRVEIARAMELALGAFRRGGRLVYVGAGTSGRLGVLDATECPPTFGTAPEMVVGVIAGGVPALTRSQEGAEDDRAAGADAMDEHAISQKDFVLGIAASGTTPYVGAALRRARERGADTGLLTCSEPPTDVAAACDVVIVTAVGPEALTGSTRLKAGTATKLILNAITTGAMIRLGKAYGNLMVDLRCLSEKLVDRGERIVMEITGVTRRRARELIEKADGSVKLAIVMAKREVGPEEAQRLLEEAGGLVRNVIGAPPPVAGSEPRAGAG